MSVSTPTRRAGRRFVGGFVAGVAAVMLVACDAGHVSTDPLLPGNPGPNPQIRSAAFIADVDLKTKQIKISAPSTSVTTGAAPYTGLSASRAAGDPSYSILAGDVVELTASNFVASAMGQFMPNKVRVTFDVNITNRLASVELITTTFPTPPPGVEGVILFPYEQVVTTTNGGVSTGGDGTDIIVELPNRGEVAASTNWNGEAHNFFNDAGCGATSSDCFRYEVYAQPLAAGGTSEGNQVGFDIDPTVSNFRARLIVVADLRNAGAAPTGTVAGSVTSPQRGALQGVTVTVMSGGFTGTTNAAGAYSISSVTTGPKTVSLSNLPAECTNPGSQNTTVSSGGTATVNFVVQCSVPSGTLQGTVSSSLGGGLTNVGVTVTPTGGAAQPSVLTNASGFYTRSAVPVMSGAGSISLSNLPSNCTNPGAQSYSGLTENATITVDITVACTPPPQGYQYTATWGPITSGQVTLTLSIDMGTFNDPAVNGTSPDDIQAEQGSITYDATRLAFVSGGNVAGSPHQNAAINGSAAGTVQWGNFTTQTPLATGLVGIAQFTFNVLGSGSVTTGTTFTVAESRGEVNLIPRILITEGTLVIP